MFERYIYTSAIIAGSLIGVQACGPGANGSGAETAGQPAPRADEASVVVQNNNWADMNVYAVRNGQRVRLGTVTSMSTERFDVPRTVLPSAGTIRLLADPIGSDQGHLSPPINVWPGQVIEWQLENHLPLSNYSVW